MSAEEIYRSYTDLLGDPIAKREAELIKRILSGGYRNIVVCTGAGASTNSGIPDYRSPTGLFAAMMKLYNVSSPEEIFTRSFQDSHDLANDPVYQDHMKGIEEATPCLAHKFCTWLHDKGWLRRVYTQNVDGLHQKAGLPEDTVVEFHGSLTKGNVVMYGETIDQTDIDQVMDDFELNPTPVDMMIAMGTSLQVAPFCAIPNLVHPTCTRVLVDLFPNNAFTNPFSKRARNYDYYSGGGISSSSVATFRKGRKKRRVSLRPQWGRRSKYKDQYIITSDVDDWVKQVMDQN